MVGTIDVRSRRRAQMEKSISSLDIDRSLYDSDEHLSRWFYPITPRFSGLFLFRRVYSPMLVTIEVRSLIRTQIGPYRPLILLFLSVPSDIYRNDFTLLLTVQDISYFNVLVTTGCHHCSPQSPANETRDCLAPCYWYFPLSVRNDSSLDGLTLSQPAKDSCRSYV